MGYQRYQHISYWSNYTRYWKQLHSFIHNTRTELHWWHSGKNTHTPSGPRNVMLSLINNQQQLKRVWHIHSPIIQPCFASTPMDRTISFTAIQFTSSLILELRALSMWVLLKKLALLNVTSKYCVPFQFWCWIITLAKVKLNSFIKRHAYTMCWGTCN
jgi:hypothetical protein